MMYMFQTLDLMKNPYKMFSKFKVYTMPYKRKTIFHLYKLIQIQLILKRFKNNNRWDFYNNPNKLNKNKNKKNKNHNICMISMKDLIKIYLYMICLISII